MRTKSIDELGQSEHRLRAVAAAIVQENDVALGCLAQGVLYDGGRGKRNARTQLAPIVWIHLLADDDVSHLLRRRKVRYFFREFGLVVDAIGRPEEQRLGAH